jgi:hypothetical protein
MNLEQVINVVQYELDIAIENNYKSDIEQYNALLDELDDEDREWDEAELKNAIMHHLDTMLWEEMFEALEEANDDENLSRRVQHAYL